MPDRRYVIQQHRTADGVHWDLMLEENGVLATFRLEEMPASGHDTKVRAEKIFDHPLRFLSYEGPVQQGTGHVHIADGGIYHIKERNEKAIALNFRGQALRGDFILTHVHETFWELARTDPPVRE